MDNQRKIRLALLRGWKNRGFADLYVAFALLIVLGVCEGFRFSNCGLELYRVPVRRFSFDRIMELFKLYYNRRVKGGK